jgi:hypothetical protein
VPANRLLLDYLQQLPCRGVDGNRVSSRLHLRSEIERAYSTHPSLSLERVVGILRFVDTPRSQVLHRTSDCLNERMLG